MLKSTACPQLGFLGLGWIGRHRMQALAESGLIEVAALADGNPEALTAGTDVAPGARTGETLEDLLAQGVDAVVIATPSALHAEQAIRALEAGCAVFCQKPVGRDAAEAAAVVQAAREADRLLGVDLSYRHTKALNAVRDRILSGALGEVQAMDVVFHNAYGPDKPWFRDRALSGGGCLIDLGVHLIDAALWLTEASAATCHHAALYSCGRRIHADDPAVEDYAVATLELDSGATLRVACSWNLHAGTEAVIGIEAYGNRGGAVMRNLNGSFYDFEAAAMTGTSSEVLVSPPDDWGGGAALAWARRLAHNPSYDPKAEELVRLSAVLDSVYAAA